MKNYPTAAIGYLVTPGLSQPGNLTPMGLQTLIFGSPAEAYKQAIASDGSVAGFEALPPLRSQDYVPVALPLTPQIGSPHFCALVQDPKQPGSIEALYWHDMPARIMNSYLSMRPELMIHPVAGFKIANFILAVAPAYVAANKAGAKLELDRFIPESELLAADDENRYRRSPEVQRLARLGGYNLQEHRNVVPLP